MLFYILIKNNNQPKKKQPQNKKTQAKLNSLTYLGDHSHVAWCMFFYTLVAECHRGQGGKSQIHHNNKLTHQNLKKQVKYIPMATCICTSPLWEIFE